MGSKFYTYEEAAAWLGYSVKYLKRLADLKKIDYVVNRKLRGYGNTSALIECFPSGRSATSPSITPLGVIYRPNGTKPTLRRKRKRSARRRQRTCSHFSCLAPRRTVSIYHPIKLGYLLKMVDQITGDSQNGRYL